MQTLSQESSSLFNGIFTALVTPFLPDGSIDWKNYDSLLDFQLQGKVHGVVPCGTTGESPTLSTEEKKQLIATAVKKCKGRAKVIAGTGSNDTLKAIQSTKQACEAGADAALVVTPYYNKPSQLGLEAHFKAIADESSIPIILYNVPGRTGVSLSASTVAKLSTHSKIVGIKEASGNLALMSEMRVAVKKAPQKKEFSFLSGDDVTFWPFLACGGNGVISVASNILPNCMRMIYEDWCEGRKESGLRLHEELSLFFNTLFIESNPVPIKAVLSWEQRMNEKTRPPLAPILPENAKKLKEAWESLAPSVRKNQ